MLIKNEDHINPKHYKNGKVECITAIEAACTQNILPFEGYCVGNIIKYIWRYKSKNGIEDLKKAQWYLNKLIKTVELHEKQATERSHET